RSRRHEPNLQWHSAMAVVIASNLRKELAGTVLFDGVSFSVERRDRVALSGPNGAGKTTLLRILASETEKHGGELAFAKGTRAARRAAAARAGAVVARVRARRGARPRRARGGASPPRAGHGGRRPRASDAESLRRGAGAARACRRIRLARPCGVGRPRARLRGGRPRPPP